jgi:hypothetical protein
MPWYSTLPSLDALLTGREKRQVIPRSRGADPEPAMPAWAHGTDGVSHGRAGRAGLRDRRVASAAVCVTTFKRAVFLLRQRVLAPESERPARALAVARAAGPDGIHAAG